MNWSTQQVRRTFLDFFREKQHTIVHSAPIVIKDDPTLMFTNAGMNQFKSIFVGNEDAQSLRIADTQKCLRVSGKHNDLEEVGRDHYHHTMFEMLGNWSFGDYFKQEAIDYAWELLVKVFGIDPDRMYVTVFGGDSVMNLALDEEAKVLWAKYLPADRILPFGKKDNFWEMGETGPCGPCSEIHVDLRTSEQRSVTDGKTLVNNDHPEVIEIWNLVFMQFNRLENGDLVPLKDKHIDTGMGLERLVRVLQGVNSNYETDVFKALIKRTELVSGVSYSGSDDLKAVAFRVIADHVRAISFCIADGQLPSNTGAGYVVRRVLRRAIRYGFSQLDMKKPFIHLIALELIDQMSPDFPELSRNSELIKKVIFEEEASFLATLERGLDRLSVLFAKSNDKIVAGDVAFELYDTFGFPIDLTNLIAEEQGWKVDMNGFALELEKQKERSRSATKTSFGDWSVLLEGSNSLFVGYDSLQCDAKIAKFRVATVKGKDVVQVVLTQTPFYAESGGQVGDRGKLVVADEELIVLDTKKENNEIIHFVDRLPQNLSGSVTAIVDFNFRTEVKKNHTATHLLHFALRKVLGTHVEQKGSMVAPDRLRFDFSHFEKIGDDQLMLIESEVLAAVSADVAADIKEMPIDDAKKLGAMALFGEKYGNRVRVVKFGESIELCGGTHVTRTSELRGFKVVSESSIASGVRRIEALSGAAYTEYINSRLRVLSQIESELGHPKDAVQSIIKLQVDLKSANKALEEARAKETIQVKDDFMRLGQSKGGLVVVKHLLDNVDVKVAKDAIYAVALSLENLLAIVLGSADNKPYVIVALGKSLAEQRNLDAVLLVKELAKFIEGGGGGQKLLAMAGGKNKQGLTGALEHAEEIIRIQTS